MFLEERAEGEPQRQWPDWFKIKDEPILTTDVGVWYCYVVLPQQDGRVLGARTRSIGA